MKTATTPSGSYSIQPDNPFKPEREFKLLVEADIAMTPEETIRFATKLLTSAQDAQHARTNYEKGRN